MRLVLERVRNHVMSPRMPASKLKEIVACLGFDSVEAFGAHIGLEKRTAESWARYGLSRDAGQLLLALLNYRLRLLSAMTDFEKMTQIPLDMFFEDHLLP
ncbi:MAG: hypothetical protein F9K44_10640 [Hyphomicrobiaceae bacterium]|nr:MAG: hypothetical protein F9K44_10640 [Hyphomicrobiaceae bacterium]